MIYKSIFAKDLFILVLPDPISSKTYLFQYLKANADLNTILRRPMQTVMASCLNFALLFFYAWMQHMRAKEKKMQNYKEKAATHAKAKAKANAHLRYFLSPFLLLFPFLSVCVGTYFVQWRPF